MKKLMVVGIIILFISVSVAPSINANIGRTPVKSKLVETSIRIHRTRGITPYTLRLTEKVSDEIDRIFDNLKVSLDSAETDKEIDEIYDDAVESLYELGMFPKMTVEEAKQLVTSEENFNCKIAGETTETYMFDLDNPFWNRFLEFLRNFYILLVFDDWNPINLLYYEGEIGQISFGRTIAEYGDRYPTKGWIWTKGTSGVVKWEGEFYGDIKRRLVYEDVWYDIQEYVYEGVKNFEGLFIDKRGEPPCYLGNAEYVSITYGRPPI